MAFNNRHMGVGSVGIRAIQRLRKVAATTACTCGLCISFIDARNVSSAGTKASLVSAK